MSTEDYYVMRLTFHPDPHVEFKEKFSTQEDAQKFIDAIANSDYWIILRKFNESYDCIKAFHHQRS